MLARVIGDEKKRNRFLKVIFSLVIFTVSIRYIGQIYQPTLLDDEYAYWSIAAYFKGYDWSSVTSLCKYYSYGYSFLLYLIMNVFDDFVMMYRAAVVVNGILLVAGFFLLNRIFGKMFPEENRTLLVTVSFLMILLPCNMSFATVNLTECLLLVLFLLSVELILEMDENTALWKCALLGIILGYSYMVHQRMIAVILSIFLLFLWMLYKKKISFRQVFACAAWIAVFLVIHHFLKADIKENLWLNGSRSSDNDYGSIFANIQYICSSLKNMVVFGIGILGKLFYFGTATYIIGFAGICMIGKKAYQWLRKCENQGDGIYAMLLMSFLLLMLISAVFMCHIEKLAWLVYGRYAEFLYPIIFGITIINIYHCIRENVVKIWSLFLGCSAVYFVMGVIIRMYVKHRNLLWVNYISCNQIYKYAQGDHLPIIKMMGIVFITAVTVIIILSIRKYRKTAQVLLVFLTFGIFLQTSEIPLQDVNLVLQKNRYETSSIVSYIMENGREDQTIYYCVSDEEEEESAQYREYIQYWLQDKMLICVTEEEWKDVDGDAWLIVSDPEYSSEERPIYENSMCRMYELK